ncbi:MAG: AEC family transporter [Candidatus Omnitrophica bacterium]|nr:AEC family transporter [Candidatus Omnitrophota bacterium]
MFAEAFQVTLTGVSSSFILGGIGFFLIKRNLLGIGGLNTISLLTVEVTLPLLIFSRLLKSFSFHTFPQWWLFPVLSLAITALGFIVGYFCSGFLKEKEERLQFISLVAFQNSGYLPLTLLSSLLPNHKQELILIYLFLFLLGFNLVMFSLGIYMLTYFDKKEFDFKSLFNPPVVATLLGLAVVWLGWQHFFPSWVLNPLEKIGDCTVPLAMIVVGGNLALIRINQRYLKPITMFTLAKLVIMPLIGLWFIFVWSTPEMLGFLIILQLAMPPATNLSVIVSRYNAKDILISQGIFWGHLFSLITIPVFLSLYFVIRTL